MDYETIFDSLPDAICAVDRTGRVVAIAPALEQLLGWRLADLSTRPLADHLSRTIADPAQALHWTVALGQAIDHALTTELALPADLSDARDPAARTTVTATVCPWRDPSGHSLGALLTLRPAGPASTRDDLRDRFAAMAAHELSSPLANISAAVDRLSAAADLDAPQRARLLQILHTETHRLRRLLGQFLADPAPPSSTCPPTGIVTLRPLLHRVSCIFELRDGNNPVAVDIPADLPFVWGDAGRIQEVLSNLVDHTLHLAAPGSPVTVTAARQAGAVVIAVATGATSADPAAEPPPLTLQLATATARALGGELSRTCDLESGVRFLLALKSVDGGHDVDE